jgi:nitroreductase
MSGIVFFATRELERVRRFYTGEIGMREWLDQGDCLVLSHGNLKIGFHATGKSDIDALITVFYSDRADVDAAHARLAGIAEAAPVPDEKHRIYHFFARDPEGRRLEFQSFDHELPPFLDGEELLHTRRSIRAFSDQEVDDATLAAVFESCRLAPSARNSQPVEFIVVEDAFVRRHLAVLLPGSSDPIAEAPLAIGIVSDPAVSPRPIEDGCIATYHLMLAAWARGLGTCWIGGLTTPEAKEILRVPQERHLITVTPLGWPAFHPGVRPRREVEVRRV